MNLITQENPEGNGFIMVNGETYMASDFIADQMDKSHSNVIRDIKQMLRSFEDESDLSHLNKSVIEEKDSRGYTSRFLLNQLDSLTLITGYDHNRRRKLAARWHDLETGRAVPLNGEIADLREKYRQASNRIIQLEIRCGEAERDMAILSERSEAKSFDPKAGPMRPTSHESDMFDLLGKGTADKHSLHWLRASAYGEEGVKRNLNTILNLARRHRIKIDYKQICNGDAIFFLRGSIVGEEEARVAEREASANSYRLGHH